MANKSFQFTRRFFLAGFATSWTLARTHATAASANTEVFAELQKGGCVVYFRHGATTWSGIDQIDWPRERQRLLSEEGIAQSRRIGQSFEHLGIPVSDVLASPFARCRDMAEIAFGRVEERFELLGLLSDTDGRSARVAFLREQMTTPPVSGTNRVIVAHRSNISEVASVALEEGEAVVVRPGGSSFEILAQLHPEDWPLG